MGRPPLNANRAGGASTTDDDEAGTTSGNAGVGGSRNSSSSPFPFSSIGSSSYQPPVWLKRLQKNKPPTAFDISLPGIPPETYKAIQQHIQSQQSPLLLEKQEISKLTAQVREEEEQVQELKLQLEEMSQNKEQSLEDIRIQREEETRKKIEQYEKTRRSQYEKERNERYQKWKDNIEEECREKIRKRKLEQESDVKDDANMEDAEPDSNTSEKQIKEGQAQASSLDSTESPTELPALKSEEKRKEVQELKRSLEKLTEQRSEMIWLLKQVIKAEEKHKKGDAK